ncbi:hypothetical protein B0H10DRAFT_1963451 [Mycena sp. CBHHK59/15]|nr:hypothetical protein B0H10DRAFT_1963451 [Mycena sp. CBHHK59/15]
MSALGSHFYMLSYDVLVRYLLGLCQKSGIEIRFLVQVSSIQLCTDSKPVIFTVSEDRIVTDVLVGADGYKSIVRDTLLLQQNSKEEEIEDAEDFDDGASTGSSLSLPPDFWCHNTSVLPRGTSGINTGDAM